MLYPELDVCGVVEFGYGSNISVASQIALFGCVRIECFVVDFQVEIVFVFGQKKNVQVLRVHGFFVRLDVKRQKAKQYGGDNRCEKSYYFHVAYCLVMAVVKSEK